MFVMLLNDKETYTNLKGCQIVCLPEGTEDVEEALKTLGEASESRKAYVVREFSDLPELGDFYSN